MHWYASTLYATEKYEQAQMERLVRISNGEDIPEIEPSSLQIFLLESETAEIQNKFQTQAEDHISKMKVYNCCTV